MGTGASSFQTGRSDEERLRTWHSVGFRRKGVYRAFYEAAPRVNVSSTRLCPLSVAARVIAWCRQAKASFYPRSKQWRHAGRRRTRGIGWGGTPSICRCSLRHQAQHRVSRSVQIMLAAARAFGRVARSLCRRADAGRLVDARIAPQGVENPLEPPRVGPRPRATCRVAPPAAPTHRRSAVRTVRDSVRVSRFIPSISPPDAHRDRLDVRTAVPGRCHQDEPRERSGPAPPRSTGRYRRCERTSRRLGCAAGLARDPTSRLRRWRPTAGSPSRNDA